MLIWVRCLFLLFILNIKRCLQNASLHTLCYTRVCSGNTVNMSEDDLITVVLPCWRAPRQLPLFYNLCMKTRVSDSGFWHWVKVFLDFYNLNKFIMWIKKLLVVTWLEGENCGNATAAAVKSLVRAYVRACMSLSPAAAAASAQMMTAAEIQKATFPGFPEAFLGTAHLPSSRGRIIFRGLLGKRSLKGLVFKICV